MESLVQVSTNECLRSHAWGDDGHGDGEMH